MSYLPLIRRPDWEERFTQFIGECREENVCLDWENFNCASWAADAIQEMTGVDPYADYRELSTPLALAKRMKHNGYSSLVDIVRVDFPGIPLVFVRRGDLLVGPGRPVSGSQAQSLASEDSVTPESIGVDIVTGALCLADPPFAWSITETGIGRFHMLDALEAFAVGEF